jgi:pyridoxamine 5'-phosphate oxidase
MNSTDRNITEMNSIEMNGTAMNLEHLRREYLRGGLRRADLPADPFTLFAKWQQQVIDCGLTDPTAMVLATVADGQPSQRIVLLKGVDERGFVFFTNYNSRKAQEMALNTQVSLLFPWHLLERQVKVAGRVVKVSQAESAHYFATRPRDSQLAAWASPQSHPLVSRAELQAALEVVRTKFGEGEIPLPEFWGGYRVVPHEVEFWQGGANRLHDCFRFGLSANEAWEITRIAP